MSLDDMPTPLALATVGLPTDAVGLDRIPRTEPDVIAVFLSASCTICRVVADAFQGGSPQRVWFVIEDTAAARHVYSGLAQASRDRVIWDAGRTIATTTGIDITPSLVGIQFGIISRAFGVSSARQVLIMIPTVTPAAHNDATMAERRALRK